MTWGYRHTCPTTLYCDLGWERGKRNKHISCGVQPSLSQISCCILSKIILNSSEFYKRLVSPTCKNVGPDTDRWANELPLSHQISKSNENAQQACFHQRATSLADSGQLFRPKRAQTRGTFSHQKIFRRVRSPFQNVCGDATLRITSKCIRHWNTSLFTNATGEEWRLW